MLASQTRTLRAAFKTREGRSSCGVAYVARAARQELRSARLRRPSAAMPRCVAPSTPAKREISFLALRASARWV